MFINLPSRNFQIQFLRIRKRGSTFPNGFDIHKISGTLQDFVSDIFISNLLGFKNMLCFLLKPEQSISTILPPMKFLFKTQFSFSDNGNSDKISVLLLKALLVLFCALFPPLLGFFIKYFKTHAHEKPLFEEDCNETKQESIDFEDIIETPFSALSFRFPTYEEFLRMRTRQSVDSPIFDSSSENNFLEENCSIPSNHDPNFNLPVREDPEFFPPDGLNCTNDIRIEDLNSKDDDRNDSIEVLSRSFDREIEDSDEIGSEDEDFIKELQIAIMEAKAKAKFPGLPSIPEESDYPLAMEKDLKPWRREETFNHRDTTKEFHKFHKIYKEKMRKYDILNHQKTYAKELKMMHSKDSVDSVLPKGFWVCRPKKADAKTGKKREIDGDLEVVYVVQLWVSWEFIVWQYKKALELYGIGAYGSCRYNEVAGKFEHFQVVIQRFMETEWFDEGSRVECYARNRLARRKILQVPLLKEDEVKYNKKKGGIDEDYNDEKNVIKIDRLIEILQESIKILWQFIRADKLAHVSTMNCLIEADHQGCKSPANSNILKHIFLDLQKKERKLKKIMKRKNCILKKFKETLEDDSELFFFTLVDLKLVSRVLNMQRITRSQMGWCHHKLSCIHFRDGRMKVEPSSFPFPSS